MKQRLFVLLLVAGILAGCHSGTVSAPEEVSEAPVSFASESEGQESIALFEQRDESVELAVEQSAEDDPIPVFADGEPYRPDHPGEFIVYYAHGDCLSCQLLFERSDVKSKATSKYSNSTK